MKKRYSIVGQKFRGLDAYLPGIEVGSEVILVREPDNKFDSNAVAVWISGQHVGYLPAKDNGHIARMIDADGLPWTHPDDLAGTEPRRSVKAIMVCSRNSSYPQVEIEE